MPVIYLSPYYSMLDYSLALEGVYGFRHHDRYGGDKAVYLNLRAYEPGAAPLGTAKQPANWMNFYGATLSDVSTKWQEGVEFNVGLDLDSREPFTFSQKSVAEIDTTNYQASFTPGSAFQSPADGVYNMRYYQEVDGDLAQATQAPGWVEGNQLAATEGAASRMWYSSYDSNLARAAGVEAFPPIGTAGQANSTLWYYSYDSALARATQSPGWVEGNALASADLFKPRNLSEANGDSTNIARVYEGYVPSTAIAPFKSGNQIEGVKLANGTNSLQSVAYQNVSTSAITGATGGTIYYELALSGSGNMSVYLGFTTAGYNGEQVTYNTSGPLNGQANLTTGMIAVTTPTATDYMWYVRGSSITEASGDIYSALFNIDAGTVRFFRNGVFTCGFTGMPSGKTWKLAATLYNSTTNANITLISNSLSWTYAATVGVSLAGYSPGGVVSGFADEVGKFPHNAEAEAVANPSLINVAVQMPVSSYPTDPVLMSSVEDEAERVDDHVQYTGYIPSTAIAPAKTGNNLEGHVLNNGSLTGSSGNWTAFFDPVGFSGASYFELRLDTVSSLMLGFTCGNGNPNNGGTNLETYNYTGPNGSAITNTSATTTNQAAYDFLVYLNTTSVSFTTGDIWSVYVDPSARIINWYQNGTLRFSINNIPTGKVWKPCFNTNSMQATARFNKLSWTKAAACGINFTDNSPGGVVDGFAVDEYPFVENQDEVSIDAISCVYEGYIPSTAIAPAKTGSPLENAQLTIGGVTTPYMTSSWYGFFANRPTTSGQMYYEVTRDSGTTTAIYGFTCGDGTPFNSGNLTNQYLGTGPNGSWITSGMNNVTNQAAYDFVVYPDNFVSMAAGEVWGAWLDIDARTIKFYRNGNFVCGYSNIPTGKAWRPVFNNYASSVLTAKFNTSTWTKTSGLTLVFGESSPGGPVSGLAVGVQQPVMAEDETGTILLRVPALDQALLDAITNRIPVSDDSVWGSSQKVWASNQLGTVTNRDPSLDQVPENLIWDSRQDVAKNDVWETRSTQLVSSMTGIFTAYLPTFDQLDFLNSVARTGVATADSCFKRPAEYVACVDSTQVEPWNYRNETALYPLKVIPTVGLSNTTSITIEG